MDSYREDIKLVAATRPEEQLLPDKQTSFRDPVMLTIGSGADQLHLCGLRAHEPCVGWGNGASCWALCDLQRILARIDESNRRAIVHGVLVREQLDLTKLQHHRCENAMYIPRSTAPTDAHGRRAASTCPASNLTAGALDTRICRWSVEYTGVSGEPSILFSSLFELCS